MGNRYTHNFTYEVENETTGEVVDTLEIELEVVEGTEIYGADADGNRGERRTYKEADGWTAYRNGKDVTASLDANIVVGIEKELNRELDNAEDPGPNYEPEYDPYDREDR